MEPIAPKRFADTYTRVLAGEIYLTFVCLFKELVVSISKESSYSGVKNQKVFLWIRGMKGSIENIEHHAWEKADRH